MNQPSEEGKLSFLDYADLPFYQQNSFDFRKDELFSAQPKSKKCRKCGFEKPFSDFTLGGNKKYLPRCKKCMAEIVRTKYRNDIINKRLAAREYRKKIGLEKRRNYESKQRQLPLNRMKQFIKSCCGRMKLRDAETLYGYTAKDLLKHIESLLQPDMTWNNYGCRRGQWSIDHIKPVRYFDLTQPENIKLCHALNNLRPRWADENMADVCKYV